jgi:hypothetical protein
MEKRQMTQMGISIESSTTKRSTGSSVNTFPKKRREKRELFEIFCASRRAEFSQGLQATCARMFAVFEHRS